MPTISGRSNLPDDTQPLVGEWKIGLAADTVDDGDGTWRGGVRVFSTEKDGSLTVTLPATKPGEAYTAEFTSRYGPRMSVPRFTFELTADTTWATIIEHPSIPPITPTLLAQAEAARDDAVTAAGSVQREQAGGIAGLTSAGKVYESRIPDRLSETELKAKYAERANAQRDAGFGAPQHEDETTYAYPTRLDFGGVAPTPPVVGTVADKGIDLIAHWYNDYGLEHEASSATQANGSYAWYDWRWNFPSNTGDGVTAYGYDPQRHPLQGFYKGDDPDVLGWQCKWLAEAGITAVSLVGVDGGVNTDTWATPSDGNHWQYQLYNNVDTFKALRWVQWLASASVADYSATRVVGDGTHPAERQWAKIIALYSTYQNGYTYTDATGIYPVVFVWDSELLRGSWDNYSGSTKTAAAFKWLADQFKAIGYDGVMVASRNPTSNGTMNRESLRNNGVIYVQGFYSAVAGSHATFADYAHNEVFPSAADQVPSVQTSWDTAYPHPSNFNLPGSTPALFGLALRRAVESVFKNGQYRMLFINNVSEWAESGPGLVPNIVDGFGYLDEVRGMPARSAGVSSDGLCQRVTAAGGATTSLTVAVPSWARKIELRFMGSSNINQNLLMTINGDAAANYDYETLTVSGATVTAAEAFAQTAAVVGAVSDQSSRDSRAVVDLYGGPSFQRAWIANSVRYRGTTTGLMQRFSNAGGWRSSAAITALTLALPAGSMRDGSVLELYCWR